MHPLFKVLVSFLPADFQVTAATVSAVVVAVLIVVILVVVLAGVLVYCRCKKRPTGKCDSFVAETVESLWCVQE